MIHQQANYLRNVSILPNEVTSITMNTFTSEKKSSNLLFLAIADKKDGTNVIKAFETLQTTSNMMSESSVSPLGIKKKKENIRNTCFNNCFFYFFFFFL